MTTDPITRIREALDYVEVTRRGRAVRDRALAALTELEAERFTLMHRATDAEVTVQNEHKLYRDAWEKYEAAAARIRVLEGELLAKTKLTSEYLRQLRGLEARLSALPEVPHGE